VTTESELLNLEKEIRHSGFYPHRATQEEYDDLANNRAKTDALFSKLMRASIREWIKLAEERLKDTKVRCYIGPGNDDRYDIDDILNSSKIVTNPEQKVVMIDDSHEMITLGNANMTPWKAPRDIDDEEIGKKIAGLISRVNNIKNCIFNLHCPPCDSRLDTAAMLDSNLTPVVKGGEVVQISAGSKSIRKAIENHQPLLGLHGHIHEGRGFSKIGRTLCINPGSEYGEGLLCGAIVDLDEKGIRGFVLTTG
jgi:hypothetical protein